VSRCRIILFAVSVLIAQQAHCADRVLQALVDRIMAGQLGTAIVLDVATGQVQAGYHLEMAARRLAAPGSAIKPFSLLALLHSGHFDPEQRVLCRRSARLAGHAMDCTHPDSAAPFNATEALAYSCNFYFASAASHLTARKLQQEFEKAGFTSETHLAAQEAVGHVASASGADELRLQALGAWGIEVTPFEMARAYRGLALRQKDVVDPALRVVFAGLEGSTAYGMAHAAQPDDFAVAGKTGTASSRTSPLTHGWFAGYAPAQDPKVVVVVFLEHGRGMDAAFLARKIFLASQARGSNH
jgi:cell division protein FtsI/penicillin-binding protein 2